MASAWVVMLMGYGSLFLSSFFPARSIEGLIFIATGAILLAIAAVLRELALIKEKLGD